MEPNDPLTKMKESFEKNMKELANKLKNSGDAYDESTSRIIEEFAAPMYNWYAKEFTDHSVPNVTIILNSFTKLMSLLAVTVIYEVAKQDGDKIKYMSPELRDKMLATFIAKITQEISYLNAAFKKRLDETSSNTAPRVLH